VRSRGIIASQQPILFAIGGSWGPVALFVLIGMLLFAVLCYSRFQIQFYLRAFTLIFMLTPIRGLLNTLPNSASQYRSRKNQRLGTVVNRSKN